MHKEQLRAEGVDLCLCMLGKFLNHLGIIHACDLDSQALGCANGDKTRQVLEHAMFWNGQHGQSNKEKVNPRRVKQVVHTQVENKTSMNKESLLT